jgi:6-phosphogluconate dehydrogenase
MTAAGRAEFGVWGLGVMGTGLALHAAETGLSVVAHDHDGQRITALSRVASGNAPTGASDAREFVAALRTPRQVLLAVPAGDAVEASLAALSPHLSEDDVIVDGGNSHYADTERRQHELAARGLHLAGCGISGGAQGARHGASLMFGGSSHAWDVFEPVARALAAPGTDGVCAARLGPGGAGHFAKMVHNGIEYAEMQLIAESYDLLRAGLGLSAERLAETYATWNEGPLRSFLVELTARLFKVSDPQTDRPLIDLVQDSAAQTGTGRWSLQFALESDVAVPTLSAAVDARTLSVQRELRQAAQGCLAAPARSRLPGDEQGWIDAARDALSGARLCAHSQGMALIAAGNRAHGWNIDRAELTRVWGGGSILASELLSTLRAAWGGFSGDDLVLAGPPAAVLAAAQPGWRAVIAAAAERGIPLPATAASLAWHDTLCAEHLPQNLVAAQRDAFGAHAFVRSDHPESGPVHGDWALPRSHS